MRGADGMQRTWAALARGWRFPLVVFVIWRLAHAVVVLLSGGSLVDASLQWDADYYLEMAHSGYVLRDETYGTFQNTAFFPGLSWLAAPLLVLGDDVAGLLLANLLAAVAFAGVWAASRALFDDKVARQATILLALWPGSVWLWSFYSEGLLVAASSWAVWAERRAKGPAVAALVYLTALTRVVGVLFGPVLAIARIWRIRRVDSISIAAVAGSASGLATVMVTQAVQVGDALAFRRSQAAWGRDLSWPWVPVVDGLDQIIGQLPGIAADAVLNTGAVVLFVVAGAWWTLWATRAPADRAPELGAWTVVAGAVPLFTTLLGSMVRFMTVAWTGFVLFGYLLHHTRPRLRWIVWGPLAAVSLIFVRRYGTGVWVG